MRLLLQSRGGRSVLTLPDDAPLHALRAAVHEKLGVAPERQLLKSGYPPSPLVGDDAALLVALGLESNETVLVEEIAAPAHLPQYDASSASSATEAGAGDGAPPYRKGDYVECYSAVAGAWVAADVVSVGYDDELVPFYTVKMRSDGREKGTIAERLRPVPEASNGTADGLERDDLHGEVSAHDSFNNCQGSDRSHSANGADATSSNNGENAAATSTNLDSSLASLLAMGFSEDNAREALRAAQGNCDEAVAMLLGESGHGNDPADVDDAPASPQAPFSPNPMPPLTPLRSPQQSPSSPSFPSTPPSPGPNVKDYTCLVCQCTLIGGQAAAIEHATATGHTNIQIIQ